MKNAKHFRRILHAKFILYAFQTDGHGMFLSFYEASHIKASIMLVPSAFEPRTRVSLQGPRPAWLLR